MQAFNYLFTDLNWSSSKVCAYGCVFREWRKRVLGKTKDRSVFAYLEKERIEESFCYYVGNCNAIFSVWEMQQLFLRKAFNDHKIPGSWTKRLSGVILVVVLLWRLFQKFICSFHVEISWKSFSIIVVLLEFTISINLLSNKSTTISTIKALFA